MVMVGFPEDVVAGEKLSNSEQNEKTVCSMRFITMHFIMNDRESQHDAVSSENIAVFFGEMLNENL
jgi:hypothetical protein